MRCLAYMPHLRGFEVEVVRVDVEAVELRVVAVQPEAACPVCGRPSSSVHSRYERHVADLCWSRARVLLHVAARYGPAAIRVLARPEELHHWAKPNPPAQRAD